jgi:hypothetical protein
MEYPQVFRNEDGVELEALNEIQAAAFEREGFNPVEKKQGRQSKKDE